MGGVEFGPAAVARYAGDEGTYLFYLDYDGSIVTDTWHMSLDDALHQAAFEYEALNWSDVDGPE